MYWYTAKRIHNEIKNVECLKLHFRYLKISSQWLSHFKKDNLMASFSYLLSHHSWISFEGDVFFSLSLRLPIISFLWGKLVFYAIIPLAFSWMKISTSWWLCNNFCELKVSPKRLKECYILYWERVLCFVLLKSVI